MVPVVVGAIEGVLSSLAGDTKDPLRLQMNQNAYQAALGGNIDALQYLKGRSGNFGTVDCGSYRDQTQTSSQCGGWATATAEKDALAKYQAIMGGGTKPSNTVVTATPGTQAGVQSGLGAFVASIFGPTATQAGSAAGVAAAQQSKNTLMTVALVGVGVIALVIVVVNARKR